MPLECESEFGEGKKLMFVSARLMRESEKDKGKVFVMLASLEAIRKGLVHALPIVCEFPEVFLEDISDFPSECEVEFSIDLVPGNIMVLI